MQKMLRILFLHGLEGSPTSTKARVLSSRGCEVVAPALPRDDFHASVWIAQAAFDEALPEVVVGSSRGGAVALSIHTGAARLVLCCPAWRRFEVGAKAPPETWILHAPADDIVPFADSIELAERSDLGPDRLVAVGRDHRLHGQLAFQAILRHVRGFDASVDPGVFTGIRWVYAIDDDRGGYYDASANRVVPDLTAEELGELEPLIDTDSLPFADRNQDFTGNCQVEAFLDPVLDRGFARFGERDPDDGVDLDGAVAVEHVTSWTTLYEAVDRAVGAGREPS